MKGHINTPRTKKAKILNGEQKIIQDKFLEERINHAPPVVAKNLKQKEVLKALQTKQVVVVEAPAGFGKSYLVATKAIDDLVQGKIKKIILSRPAVGMGPSIGLLKGDMRSKFEPYLMPLVEVITERWGNAVYETNLDSGNIEFAPLEYLRGRNFKGVTIVDECFPDDTEVLTPSGFKLFRHLTETDEIAQYDEKGNISFTVPSRLIEKPFTGDLSVLSKGNIHITTTPNHDLVYQTNKGQVYKKKASEPFLKSDKIVLSGYADNGVDYDEDTIRLACLLQAEGHYQKVISCGNDHYYWTVTVKKERKLQMLRDCLHRLGIKYSEYEPNSRGVIRFWLGKLDNPLLHNTQEKNFNVENIIKMSQKSLNFFREEVLLWDGYVKDKRRMYCSTNKVNIDCLQAVCHMTGVRGHIIVSEDKRTIFNKPPKRYYRLNISDTSVSLLKRASQSTRGYSGYVYCATVETGMIVVRQEGEVFISGNCQNVTPSEMYTILTRLHDDGKLFLIGDRTQNDLKGQTGIEWLCEFIERHDLHENVEVIRATSDDIVRGSFCKAVVKAKERDVNHELEKKK